MNERIEFNEKGKDILDFIDIYGMLKCEHVEKFFPRSRRVLNYLIRSQRLYKSPDKAYISAVMNSRPDKCLIAALGVLADVIGKVQSYARATAPAQISFFTYSGDYYEIVYVGYGMEAMITASIETQLAMTQRSGCTGTIKRMVIVEEKNQMTRLSIPGITRFALIQPDGSLSYFKGS